MRASRRATLCTTGLVWDKYKYVYVETKELTGYYLEAERVLGEPSYAASISGYEDYDIVRVSGEHYDSYRLTYSNPKTVTKDNPGWVYASHMQSDALIKYTLDSSGQYVMSRQDLVNRYENVEWKWIVTDRVGVVRAKDGEYPDTGRGLTYVKTDGDYTIMTDGENHYAYKLRG